MPNFVDCWGALKAKGYKHADGSEVLNDQDRASIEARIQEHLRTGLDPIEAAKASVKSHLDEAHAQLQSIYDQVKPPAETPTPVGEATPQGQATVPEGYVRLYRVEPKEITDSGEWLKKHLTPEQWQQFTSERGRNFTDDVKNIVDYGHGDPQHTTFYVDVPKDVAEASKRRFDPKQRPGMGEMFEYQIPAEYASKKQPLETAPVSKAGQAPAVAGQPKTEGGIGEEVQKGQEGREAVLATERVQPPAAPPELPKSIAESTDPSNVTSIKNEIVDRERAARGLEPVVEPSRKAFGESWEQASKKINDDPQYVDNLLTELRGKPRALTDVEDAALLHRQIDLQNRFDKTAAELVRAQESGDADAIAENRVRHAAISDQLLDLYDTGKASGTETGRGLAARKLLANENFTLANMVTQKRAAVQGKPLTPEQMAEVEGYNKDILEANRKLQEYEKQPKKESARIKAAKTRMEVAKTDLERRIAFSDYEKAQRAEPIKLDKDGLELRADLERKKQEFWQSLMKDRLAQRTLSEKVQDTFTKWRRGFILSSPNVLAKLTSAAVERMAFTPIEEAAGKVLSKVPGVSQVAERSSFHPSITSEAKAITEGFTAGMKDAWDVLRTGRSSLDVQFGKKNVMPPSAIDFIGQLHGALKTIPKRNEFARRFQQGVETAISNGVDATDPLVQVRIATQAYKEANRSIFLQDNRVVAAWQRAISSLEQPSKTTGVVPPGSKALATTMKVLFPIVKVPTNIVAETLQYSTGLVTGSARLGNAFRNGINNLKPEQADLIMRELKKGSVGGAALLLGYLNADKIGGYYQPGQKRSKEDVKFGQIRLFGVGIPTYLIHNPLLEQLQIGATIRRVAESKLRKKDTGPQGIPAGVLAAGLGVTEEVPFVRETLGELPKLFHPNERTAFLGELTKSLAVPQVVQWAAYQTDKRNGEPVKRKADTILEHIETGIPGLRQRVPEKQDRTARQPFAQ